MKSFRTAVRCQFALGALVVSAASGFAVAGVENVLPTSNWCLVRGPYLGQEPTRLYGGSAIELVEDCATTVESPWTADLTPPMRSRAAPQDSIEPHITSVPVGLIVGGLMIVSLGISKRVRRLRAMQT